MRNESEAPRATATMEAPATQPLNETAWMGWITKGRAQDQRRKKAFRMALKLVVIAGLVVVAFLWSRASAAGFQDFLLSAYWSTTAIVPLAGVKQFTFA